MAPTRTVAKYLLSTYPYGHESPLGISLQAKWVMPILLYLYLSSVVLTTVRYMSSFYISQVWALDNGHRALLLFRFLRPDLALSTQQEYGACGTDG